MPGFQRVRGLRPTAFETLEPHAMKIRIVYFAAAMLAIGVVAADTAQAQRRSGTRGGPGGRGGPPTPQTLSTVSPVETGEAGIAWYGTWEVAKAEAIRSNRPILFMAATTQCGGVPGVF